LLDALIVRPFRVICKFWPKEAADEDEQGYCDYKRKSEGVAWSIFEKKEMPMRHNHKNDYS